MWPQRVNELTRTLTAGQWAVRLTALGNRLREGVLESATLFPGAVKQRQVVRGWITTARAAQIALLVVVALNVFVMPPVRDRLVDAAFDRESFAEKVGGVFGSDSKWDRRRAAAGRLMTTTAWFGGAGTVLLLLWLHLPAAVRGGAAPTRCLRPATVSKRYQLEAEIGRGASGVVHRARDTILERRVALKELAVPDADDDAVERFRREAKIVAQLSHPNIVQVYDLVDEAGRIWIAMEWVECGDLSQTIADQGPLPFESAARIAHAIAQAIAYAHGRGIVHRDLKPQNVLVDQSGIVKVTDFGLAKIAGTSVHTIEGTILGSPHYMSPEQADGRTADERSDIYSLGAILYHMLAGRPPFEGQITSVLMQHVRRPVSPLSTTAPGVAVPRELETLLMQMLAKDPDERPQTMRDTAQRLALFTVARV
jgi:tRNA A-37 threonylcarbamoyl transferase component Bud32